MFSSFHIRFIQSLGRMAESQKYIVADFIASGVLM